MIDDEPPLGWFRQAVCAMCQQGLHDLCLWSTACICLEPACTDRLARWEPLP